MHWDSLSLSINTLSQFLFGTWRTSWISNQIIFIGNKKYSLFLRLDLCDGRKDIEFADFQVNLSKTGLIRGIYCFFMKKKAFLISLALI